jgi:aspartyl/asparaginyl beta-hydroxylase (cupin superfamily)
MYQLLERFLVSVEASATGDTIGFEETKRYWRIIRNTAGMRIVYCFVRKADGAIFPPANYILPRKGKPWGHIDNYEPVLLSKLGLTPPVLRPAMRRKLKYERQRQKYERHRQEALEIVEAMSAQYRQAMAAQQAVPAQENEGGMG